MAINTVGADYDNYDEKASWLVDLSGKYTKAIKDYLIADGIPETGADKIIQNAAEVLGYCPNPCTDEEVRTTGIVIGKVQSGKTSNFIAITALAFDNGYSHVVVFGGTKKPLVSQNSQRINEYFETVPDVIVLNTTEHLSQLTSEHLQQFVEMGKKVIVVALKSPAQIMKIKERLFNDIDFSQKATLIIDDEGDEASLNTLVKKGKKSSTYKAIEELKTALGRHCFLSVTATPQANLLISSMDLLSPDFGVLIDPGEGYCGLDVFHSPDSTYTVEIPENEPSLLDGGIPTSFYQALSTFFVACGIFFVRGFKNGDKLSMLIHPSQKKVDHALVIAKTETVLEVWRTASKNKNDLAYRPLQSRLRAAYDDYKSSGVKDLPPFSEIEDHCIRAIQYCGLHLVNGDSVPNGADKFYDYNIYVGGAMLGRGLTLKGLAITYIIRTAKGVSMVDTVQQRARWFGYKTKYLDLCRVFAVKKIIKDYRGIREHENDLWATVRDANIQGTHFKDIARIFLLSDNLRMTRTSVATADRYVFKPWNIQTVFQYDQEYSASNIAVIENYKERYSDRIITKAFGSGAPFSILEQMPFDSVKEEIINRYVFPQGAKFNGSVVAKLATLFRNKGIAATIDVIWMRDGITSKHAVNDGDIGNYFVGRRPEDYSKPAIYEGDRYQFVKPAVMQLQIHMIEDSVSGTISPALAVYIPKEYIERLTNLVIRSE